MGGYNRSSHGKRYEIENIFSIMWISRTERELLMESIRVIGINNNETLLYLKKLHDIHDSRLWVNILLLIGKNWGTK